MKNSKRVEDCRSMNNGMGDINFHSSTITLYFIYDNLIRKSANWC